MMLEETRGLHLLLIEGDANVAATYALPLMAAGHDVRVIFDGRAGLRAARRRPPPDLLLLDVQLPQMDGYALLERLREDPVTATVPVVILSNLRTPEMARRGIELGAMAHLLKSETSPLQLRARIDAWCESKIVARRETLDLA
jgi:putative two-component system response regulator